MIHQPFDHTTATSGRHDDAAEFEARRRLAVEFGPATTRAEMLASIDAARAAGDADMVSVLQDELEAFPEEKD